MKKIKRDALIASGCSLAVNLLALIIIPAVIIGLFSAVSRIPGVNSALRPRINKADIPKEISVYITATGETKKIAFEDYVTGVVAAKCPLHLKTKR